MTKFTLEPGRWYATEFIGDEFGEELRSYSPIRIERVVPKGGRQYVLAFYHANYPAGVRDKEYELETLERSATFVLARSRTHVPPRLMLIYGMTSLWLRNHFSASISESDDCQAWLTRFA